ncbi:MAG: FecR domain-containing protein [Bacteroidota bacterium]
MDKNLITKYLLGETTPEETRQVADLINTDEQSKAYFNSIKKVWEAAEVQKIAENIDVEAAIDKFLQKIEDKGKVAAVRPIFVKSPALNYMLRIAAVIVLGLAFWLIFLNRTEIRTIATGEEKTYRDTLPDGSVVYLNSYTTLKYPEEFDDDIREVFLEGEAFFEVAGNKDKSFVVNLDNAIVKALGTSFNISAYPAGDSIEVIVSAGRVLLYSVEDDLTDLPEKHYLEKGDRGVFSRISKKVVREINTNHNFLYWETGILAFKETPLPEVIKVLNKEFNQNIVLGNENLENCILTAEFNNKSVEAIAEILEATFGLEVKREGNKIILLGNGC